MNLKVETEFFLRQNIPFDERIKSCEGSISKNRAVLLQKAPKVSTNTREAAEWGKRRALQLAQTSTAFFQETVRLICMVLFALASSFQIEHTEVIKQEHFHVTIYPFVGLPRIHKSPDQYPRFTPRRRCVQAGRMDENTSCDRQ